MYYYFFEIDKKRYIYPASKILVEYDMKNKIINIIELNTTYRKFAITYGLLYVNNNMKIIFDWMRTGVYNAS